MISIFFKRKIEKMLFYLIFILTMLLGIQFFFLNCNEASNKWKRYSISNTINTTHEFEYFIVTKCHMFVYKNPFTIHWNFILDQGIIYFSVGKCFNSFQFVKMSFFESVCYSSCIFCHSDHMRSCNFANEEV